MSKPKAPEPQRLQALKEWSGEWIGRFAVADEEFLRNLVGQLVSIENPATEDGREPTKGEFWIVGYTRDAIFPNAFDGAKGDSTVRRSSIVTIDGLAIWLIAGTKVTAKLAGNRKKTVTLD